MDAVELVRRGYAAYAADGVEGILGILDPEIEWRNPPDSPNAGIFRGHDGVREWFKLTEEAFSEIGFTPREIIEAPDGRILAICDAVMRGRGSDVVIEVPFAHVIEVRDGLAVYFQMVPQVDEARALVGLD